MRPASRTDRTARRVAGVLVASGLALAGSFVAASLAGADTSSPPAPPPPRVAGGLAAPGPAPPGSFVAAPLAGADTSSPPALAVVLDGRGAAFDGAVEITCESPAVADAHGVDIGSALRSTRENF